MPAVTADPLTVPSIPAPDPTLTPRPVRSVTTAPRGTEGEGFPVRRAFAGVSLAELDPFVHMDQMGEVDYAPGEPRGTNWHPHRGFETVTYIMDGAFLHQDSHGGGGSIENGATQWMTAGQRHPPHRDPTRGVGHQRRALPRPAAVGQLALERQDDRAAVPEPGRRPRDVAVVARRRCPRPPHRRRHRRSPGSGLDAHADRRRPPHAVARGADHPPVAA